MMLNGWLKNTMDMETKFNFNSQVCTDKVQSERLLALGLKKETADMAYRCYGRAEDDSPMLMDKPSLVYQGIMTKNDIPAWSLHRLIEMMPKKIGQFYRVFYNYALIYEYDDMSYVKFTDSDIYDRCISCIEWLIEEGYFNKEYLV